MSAISLRLPDSLHATVRALAEREGISINQLITLALAEKISALLTEEYLGTRAQSGNRTRFEGAMARVPDVEPAESDRLPSQPERAERHKTRG